MAKKNANATQVVTPDATNNTTPKGALEQKWEQEATMPTQADLDKVKEALNEVNDPGVADAVASAVMDEIKAAVAEISSDLDPIDKIRVRLLGKMTAKEMAVNLVPNRHKYEQIERFAQAIDVLYNKDKAACESLVLDFYIAWVELFHLSDDEVQGLGLTRDSIKQFKSSVFARVEDALIPEWYKRANTKLLKAEFTTSLLSNTVYHATKAVGGLGVRVPEAIVETAGKTVVNTIKAVHKSVDLYNVEADKRKRSKEIDDQVAQLKKEKETLLS